jgi:glutathione S-transferase
MRFPGTAVPFSVQRRRKEPPLGCGRAASIWKYVIPLLSSWHGGDDAVVFYRENRIPVPDARQANKLEANAGLNSLNDDLEGRHFCGDQIIMAEIILYAFMAAMIGGLPWLNPPRRINVSVWFERMGVREASQRMMEPFRNRISV